MTALYCKPWVGEFGWELCFYNPLVRYHAKKYNHVIVAAPKGSQYLYEFADKFIPLDTIGTSYCDGQLLGDYPIINADKTLSPHKEFAKHSDEPERISTKRLWRNLSPESPGYVADVLCAFRPIKRIDGKIISGKQYPFGKCQHLVEILISRGLSVACFGGVDNYCPDGAEDLRGQSLEKQCSAISSAKCVVGPSSGPIHLASLCGCPHVTWIASIHHTLEKRYKKLWNPFNTPVEFICQNRVPSPKEVVQNVDTLLDKGILDD
jgi:hypothetical protein